MRWIDRLDQVAPGDPDTLIWPVRLDDPSIRRRLSMLRPAPEDLAHAAGKAPDGGTARLARRLLLKALAGQALGVSAGRIRVEQEASGGPLIRAPEPRYASAAGRGDWAVLGLGVRPLGVDLETFPPEHPLPADLLHESERRMLAALSGAERDDAFLRLWTVKEAYAKASGIALDRVLGEVAVELEDGRAALAGVTAAVELRRWPEFTAAAVALP